MHVHPTNTSRARLLYIPCMCSAAWELLALEGLVREEGLVMWLGVARGNRGSGDVPVSPKKYLQKYL